MVTSHADSMEALKKIKGVGEAHLTKYGNPILEALRTARARQSRLPHAAPVRERVIHHAIVNVCGDSLERGLIDDCFAC